MALPGTDVNLAGRAPARLAVHCCLATGGPGAAMRHAPFGRPRRPLGTFPRGESTSSARRRAKPLTRNRLSCGRQGKGVFTFLFYVSQRISPLRRRPKGFPSPFGNLRRPPVEADGSRKKRRFLVQGKGKELYFLSFCLAEGSSPLRRRAKLVVFYASFFWNHQINFRAAAPDE